MPKIIIKGSIVNTVDTGTGAPVILLHCSAASNEQWDSLGAQLGERSRVIALDQWGCGASDPWPGHKPFTLSDEAEPVHRVLDDLDEPVHLVGHSYGGGVALNILSARPESIRGLTLIEPSAFHLLTRDGSMGARLYDEIIAVAGGVREAALCGDQERGMERFVDYWNGAGAWAAMSDEARAKLSRRLAKVVLDFRALLGEETTLARFANLRIPTTLIRGESSPRPSCRIVEMLKAAIPGAKVETVAGAGHMSPFSHRDAVNRIIRNHIDAVQPAIAAAA